MDPRVREVMEGAMGQCNNEIRSLEPLIEAKMASSLDACYGRNSSNADRFAECILDKNKRVEDIMKGVEFKMLFYSKAANQCLINGKSVSDCTQDAIKGIKEVIENSRKSIDKL